MHQNSGYIGVSYVMNNNINYNYITEYIRNIITQNKGILKELEEYAQKSNIPIIQPEVAKFIQVIGKIKKPKKVLEIGTAVGYSSILMAGFLKDGGKIISIERHPKMVEQAKSNIKKAGLENSITVLEGEAQEILPKLTEKFDLIFIDASKGHYLEFFNYCIDLLNDNGVLISDNVLYKGMVASDDLVERRKKTIVKRMREYLNHICNHEQLDTSIIPIGDGIALSIKRS